MDHLLCKMITTENQFCDVWITYSSRKFFLRTVKQELLVTGVKHKFCLQKKSERRNESIFWANANFHARPTFPVSFRSNYPSDTLFSLRADSIMISGSIPSFPRPVFFLMPLRYPDLRVYIHQAKFESS